MREVLYVYHVGVAENILGPGRRVVVWFSGCPHHCPGCIEEKRWGLESGEFLPVEEIRDRLNGLLPHVDGITFSGGEPLYQDDGLLRLTVELPPGTDRMLFTGYRPEELDERRRSILERMDICVSGRFERSLHGNHLWRGSSNQVISSPTGKYDDGVVAEWMGRPSAGVQLHMVSREIFVYGIPVPGALDRLKSGLQRGGVILSEQ